MQVAKEKAAPSVANLEAFVADKAQQWARAVRLASLFNQGFSSGAAAYQAALEALKSGKKTEAIVTDLKGQIQEGRGRDVSASMDILTFIESGQPLLPLDVLDMPSYVAAEQKKANEETARKLAEMRREHEAEMVKREEEEKKAKRQALAEELGLQQDALEQLKAGS